MIKKRYYKNGDPELYNEFSDWEVKNWTDRERSMWFPSTDVEEAPIPRDVIEFQQEQQSKLDELEKVNQELKAQLEKANNDLGEPVKEELTEEQEIKLVREELRQRGIRFAPNSKLETLKKKLKDADN